MRRTFVLVFLHAVFCFALIAAFASAVSAQPQSTAQSTTGDQNAPAQQPTRAYDTANEVVISGTISEVVKTPATGLPLGLHLMVATGQGLVDVHLGPYQGRTAAQNGLVAGATLRITGLTKHFDAGDVFLARLVVVNNKTITVRNENGFPVRPTPANARTAPATQTTGGL